MEHRDVILCYREYAPDERLREHVRALFSFVPGCPPVAPGRRVTREIALRETDSFCAPLFADGNGSLVFELGMVCREQSGWRRNALPPHGHVIGAMSRVGRNDAGERTEMVGVYFRPAGSAALLDVPASELTDLVLPLSDLWGAYGGQLPLELDDVSESARLDRVESELLHRLARARAARRRSSDVDVFGLANWIAASRGQHSVEQLADAAGVSRQHLTRVFRERVGVTPKVYSRLARFQSGLAYSGLGARAQWSRIAAELGYADQSHMIAEFREFSSLTPQQLAARHWFHPFIERAKSRLNHAGSSENRASIGDSSRPSRSANR